MIIYDNVASNNGNRLASMNVEADGMSHHVPAYAKAYVLFGAAHVDGFVFM
jgi:hypothetical protein